MLGLLQGMEMQEEVCGRVNSLDGILGVVVSIDELLTIASDLLNARLIGGELGFEILVLLQLALQVGRILENERGE